MSKGKVGGNRRPQTFRLCAKCGRTFGPLNRLSQRFCSRTCAYAAATTGRQILRRTIPAARSAQSLLRYHVQAGNIVRPSSCEACGALGRIEGAHFNYGEPLRVRWLCRSCHVRWDKAEPKGGTVIVARAAPAYLIEVQPVLGVQDGERPTRKTPAGRAEVGGEEA